MTDNKHATDNPTISEQELKTKSSKELDALLNTAKRSMSDCLLQSSWTFTVPSVLISVPLSIHFKTYSPLAMSAVIASGIDYYHAFRLCGDLNANIDKIKYAIAVKEHGEKNPREPLL